MYRILSIQCPSRYEYAIYTLVFDGTKSVRIMLDRRETWEVGDVIQLDDQFVRENEQP